MAAGDDDGRRDFKIPLYGRAGVPEVWLVNVVEETIEVFKKPSSEGYETHYGTKRADFLSPEELPRVSLQVQDILIP